MRTRTQKIKNGSSSWSFNNNKISQLNVSENNKEIISNLFEIAYTHSNITQEMLWTRRRTLVETNAVICTIINSFFKLSLTENAKLFNKHHATAIHYIGLYNDSLCMDKQMRELHEKLSNHIIKKLYGDSNELETVNLETLNLMQLRELIAAVNSKNVFLNKKIKEIKNVLDR